jgi:hypothetical protein
MKPRFIAVEVFCANRQADKKEKNVSLVFEPPLSYSRPSLTLDIDGISC